MTVQVVPAAQAIAALADFDAVIDARSESEYAEDRLPGAINWPSLDDEQRKLIGTIYKQVSPFEARKRGAALVAANVARHIEREVLDKPKGWRPLVYCWRGGKRSGALSLILDQIGFRVTLVEGGYKAFRSTVLAQLPQLAEQLSFRVICGPTGSGKTRLLHALAAQGAQVLDLEGLAHHRSSVLGLIPGEPQPSQKAFETRIWQVLRSLDAARPVFVESESRKVGNVAVPEPLILAMRSSACLRLVLADDERVRLLMEDYEFFARDPELFCQRLNALTEIRGKAVVARWQALVRAGEVEPVVRELLLAHYDPGYSSSTQRNFVQFVNAPDITPQDRSPAAMETLAQQLLKTCGSQEACSPG